MANRRVGCPMSGKYFDTFGRKCFGISKRNLPDDPGARGWKRTSGGVRMGGGRRVKRESFTDDTDGKSENHPQMTQIYAD
jgi:hypothetical protein